MIGNLYKTILGVLFIQIISFTKLEAQNKIWPYPVPCRINDDISDNVLFLTLGDVQTPVAQGMFYPVEDKVVLNDGTVINNYFHDSLGLEYYSPLNKNIYNKPPAGWVSWQPFLGTIDEDTIKTTADYIKDNLVPFGLKIFLIDDGWETPWYIWKPNFNKFPDGVKGTIDYVKQDGLSAGLWIVPQGTSDTNNKLFYNAFVHDKAGNYIHTSEWLYTVDPSAPDAKKYFTDLMDTVKNWGITYLKFDSQPHVDTTYDTLSANMNIPNMSHTYYYRISLQQLRQAIGDSIYIDATWGPGLFGKSEGWDAPLTALGYINGARPYWDLQKPTFYYCNDFYRGVLTYSYLNNIVSYIDLDAFFVGGNTLSISRARWWASMASLSGVSMFDADNTAKLDSNRLDILKRVFPTVDIRPLDLYPIYHPRKHIWDLKINQVFRQYDVVGVIKSDYYSNNDLVIRWNSMGWERDDSFHVYDFWNKRYLGINSDSMVVNVPDSSCTVLSFVKVEDRPVVVSTSRHITQGWVDIDTLSYDSISMLMKGISSVVGNDPYEIRIAVPNNKTNSYIAVSANVADIPFHLHQDSNFITLSFTSPVSAHIPWSIQFAQGPLSITRNNYRALGSVSLEVYPNPFERATGSEARDLSFIFTIPGKQRVNLGIYNLIGERIATIFDGYAGIGTNTINYNVASLHNGVYFSVLHNGIFSYAAPFIIEK